MTLAEGRHGGAIAPPFGIMGRVQRITEMRNVSAHPGTGTAHVNR
jgi:hypothetical protein